MADKKNTGIKQTKPSGTQNLNLGILAHVDAGKTTLAERLLYASSEIRKLGRVDNKDAFLDTYEMEKERGITIFSKQAQLKLDGLRITLLDTPGHVDFSAEMERTLSVMDYALLVISGADGVQSHTETLWRLLSRYEIPVFLFVNKMDQPGCDQAKLQQELETRLSDACVCFDGNESEDFYERIALCEEETMEEYLREGELRPETLTRLVAERKLFPVIYGSALKTEEKWNRQIRILTDALVQYTASPVYGREFAARVYKISRDAKGERLTHLKVTGGVLKTRDLISGYSLKEGEAERWEEKINQIRLYSGASFTPLCEAPAGCICAVTGLSATYAGQGLGAEEEDETPILEPVLSYSLVLPRDADALQLYGKLKILEEEIPELHLLWNAKLTEIQAQVMGEVQTQILQKLIRERFGVWVEFGTGKIVYKETLAETVEGVGHFEPLRHYAEVHLRLEPGERGSGITIDSECSEDLLSKNWQRLIFTHLLERKHPGVLGGFEVTDIRIVLTAGRAHIKHTEGGDFRQATYRAVRQGLKKGICHLLEPYYTFRLEIPVSEIGRAMMDVQKMGGTLKAPVTEGEFGILTGTAPVSEMKNYQKEVSAYTGGRGRFSATLLGYQLCHNEEEVLANLSYDSELDMANPTGSVFCAHGSGFYVPWDQVEDYMHLESSYEENPDEGDYFSANPVSGNSGETKHLPAGYSLSLSEAEDKELEEIFQRTFKKSERKKAGYERKRGPVRRSFDVPKEYRAPKEVKEQYLLVDGYNIIFGWEELKQLAAVNLESARGKLMDILCNYQGYKKCTLILVFDAYKVKENPGSVQKYHNIHVVYTKEAETADMYIEKTVHEISKNHQVTVATSDGLEQIIILGQGAVRLSAREFQTEVENCCADLRENWLDRGGSVKNYLLPS